MQGTTLLEQGLSLMLVGMGTVFVFLTALVFAMSVMASIVKRMTPRVEEGISDEEIQRLRAELLE